MSIVVQARRGRERRDNARAAARLDVVDAIGADAEQRLPALQRRRVRAQRVAAARALDGSASSIGGGSGGAQRGSAVVSVVPMRARAPGCCAAVTSTSPSACAAARMLFW